MDPAYLSAAAALSGSLIGGLTSALTNWVSWTRAKAALVAREISRRDELYKEFIRRRRKPTATQWSATNRKSRTWSRSTPWCAGCACNPQRTR